MRTIAICGNGASAALLLVSLAKHLEQSARIVVVGTGDRCGAGIAYSTSNLHHSLNAPAARMSADLSAPQQFKQWLEKRGLLLKDFAAQFVSRSFYAQYLDELLKERVSHASNLDTQFITAEVQNIIREDHGWIVVHRGGRIFADLVVLATGNDMPAPITPLYRDFARYIIDVPWGDLPLAQEENVLVLGAGLTAMDAVVTLLDRGHKGTIHLLSRRGWCPARHVSPIDKAALARPFPTTTRGVIRALRRAVGPRPSPEEWQGVMDNMRPFWSEIWQLFSQEEKARFLRHGVACWRVHRHRLAPAMADRIEKALRHNLKTLKGRLTDVTIANPNTVTAVVTYRGESRRLQVNRIINCTGPNSNPTKSHYPLIQNIIASRHARSGTANIGLDVDAKNRVRNASGSVHTNLFAMGALTRGSWWEITAIPEIARQALEMAGHIRFYLAEGDSGPRIDALETMTHNTPA